MKRRTARLAGILVALLGAWSPGASGSTPLDLSSPRTTGDERAGDSSVQIVPHTGGSTDVYWMRDNSRIMHAAIGASGTVTPEQPLTGVVPSSGVLRAAPVGPENSLLVWIERESPTRLLYRYALVNGTTLVAGPSTLGIAAERTSDGTLGPRSPLIRTTPSGDAFVVWLEAAEPTRILSRLVRPTGAVGPTAEIEPEQSPNWGTEMAAAVSGSALVVAWTKRDTARIDGVLTGGATGVARAVVTGTGAVDVKTVAPPSGGITPGNVAVIASPATTVVGWTETTGFGSAWSYRAQRLTASGEPSGTPETWASGTNPSFSGPPQTAVAAADSGLGMLVTYGFGRPTNVVAFSPDGSQQGAWELTSAQVLEPPVLIPQRGNVRVAWVAGTSLQSRSVTADGPGEVQTIGPVENATYPPGALHGVRGSGRVLIGWHQERPDAGDPTSNAVGTFVASLEGDAPAEGPPPAAPAQPGEPETPATPPADKLPVACNGVELLCVEPTFATASTPGSTRKPCDPGADTGWVNVAGTTFACIFTGDIWDDPTLISAKQKCVTSLAIDAAAFTKVLKARKYLKAAQEVKLSLATLATRLRKASYPGKLSRDAAVVDDLQTALALIRTPDQALLTAVSSRRVLDALILKLGRSNPGLAKDIAVVKTALTNAIQLISGIQTLQDCKVAFAGP